MLYYIVNVVFMIIMKGLDVRKGSIIAAAGLIIFLGFLACDDRQTFEPPEPIDKYVYGKVTDDAGNPLKNVTVSIYDSRADFGSGNYITSPVTNAEGEWSDTITIDQSTNLRLVYSHTGYLDLIATAFLSIGPPDTLNIGTASIPPTDMDDEFRVVLTWGSSPSDLDAHLTGPKGNDERFHVYWNNKIGQSVDGDIVARLISDRRGGYGPESIAIKQLLPGTYRFSVHNYSANEVEGDSSLVVRSNAKVRVFSDDGVAYEFDIAGEDGPDEKIGNTWRVFEINGETGTITYVNQIFDGIGFREDDMFRFDELKHDRLTIP